MAFDNPPNLRHLHRRYWLPQQCQRPVIEPNQGAEMRPLPQTTKEAGSPSVFDDHGQYPSDLRDILESDKYQVALILRGEWDHFRPQVTPFSTEAPAVLLPFNWKELVARVCEILRDSNAFSECRFARFEDVCVDFTKMEVSRSSGEPIALTRQEFKTLKCLLLNPDRVFSRGELLREAWGYENYPSTRTVDNHVLKLRQKLERDPARPVHFQTVHRVGYKFVP